MRLQPVQSSWTAGQLEFRDLSPQQTHFRFQHPVELSFNDGNDPGNWSVTVINPGSRAIRSFSSSHVKS
jgi:hypothetical protein